MELYVPKSNSDYCFVKNNVAVVNNDICIGATNVQVNNDNIHCTNAYNEPVLKMKKDEYLAMCKDLSKQVVYKYITDLKNPAHVNIPNNNKYVRCSNNQANICIFTESNDLAGNNIQSSYNQFSSMVSLY